MSEQVSRRKTERMLGFGYNDLIKDYMNSSATTSNSPAPAMLLLTECQVKTEMNALWQGKNGGAAVPIADFLWPFNQSNKAENNQALDSNFGSLLVRHISH
jgi:hypothetical protein